MFCKCFYLTLYLLYKQKETTVAEVNTVPPEQSEPPVIIAMWIRIIVLLFLCMVFVTHHIFFSMTISISICFCESFTNFSYNLIKTQPTFRFNLSLINITPTSTLAPLLEFDSKNPVVPMHHLKQEPKMAKLK